MLSHGARPQAPAGIEHYEMGDDHQHDRRNGDRLLIEHAAYYGNIRKQRNVQVRKQARSIWHIPAEYAARAEEKLPI